MQTAIDVLKVAVAKLQRERRSAENSLAGFTAAANSYDQERRKGLQQAKTCGEAADRCNLRADVVRGNISEIDKKIAELRRSIGLLVNDVECSNAQDSR